MINPKDLLIPETDVSESVIAESMEYCEGYKAFLDKAKTEREFVVKAAEYLENRGYVPFEKGKKYAFGDKVYKNHRGKSLFAFKVGENTDSAKIVASHIDSPRLDLKMKPVYEEAGLGYFKTHYYGGIKKYQWTAIPLALHGVIAKKDGTVITVCLGEEPNEPCFTVTDLLPHLGAEQGKRTLSEGIKGEELNVLVGSLPFKTDDESNKVKLNIIKLLGEKYGICEWDLFSAELNLVPAFKARDIGFDCSLIGAYGQDDKVCAYTSLTAFCASEDKNTCVLVLADKEEIGSDGNTGLSSSCLEYFLFDIAAALGKDPRDFIRSSEAFSADVTAGFDPSFPGVYDKLNSAFMGKGAAIMKYTGAKGKYDTSDASAEFTAKVRDILDSNGCIWQVAELGKVDEGGGGTVAKYLARMDMDVIDIGVPVLSMHSPFEITSKLDVLYTTKAFSAFLNY